MDNRFRLVHVAVYATSVLPGRKTGTAQMLKHNIDKDWFLLRLEEKDKSVRGLARHMEIDPSAVSRMLSGERRMKMEEATSIAQFLGVHVKEVLKHAGVAVDLDGQQTRILLTSTIDKDGVLHKLKEPRPLPQYVIDRAHAAIAGIGNGKIIAAQIRANEGALAVLDDAVVLFRYSDTFNPSSTGPAIVRCSAGVMGLGRIIRARKTGEASVLDYSGKIHEVDLLTASEIIAIIP